MKNTPFQINKRIFAIVLLLISLIDVALPVMADTMVTSGDVLNQVGGQYGANLNSVTGANVSTDYTNATITNTQQASTLIWNSLNTAPGQSLNYVFNGPGQVSLNSVTGTGLSTFAGALTSQGDGRVIISNPNGIIFENGSYTNVNALTLTTQGVNLRTDGSYSLFGDSANGTIKIGGVGASTKAAVMRIADDLNIVSNGIKIANADILAGNNIRLITTDGVTFLADGKATDIIATNVNAQNSTTDSSNSDGNNVTGTIIIDKASLAVKNNTDGKIYLVAKGDDANVAAVKSAMDGKIALDVDGNADLELIGNLDVVDSYVSGDLIAKTLDEILTLTGNNTVSDTEITTVGAYLVSAGYLSASELTDAAKVKAALKLMYPSASDSELTLMAGALNSTYQSVTTTVVNNTDTTISGKGSVSIADTTVGGNVKVDGAGVKIANLTAKTLDVKSTAGSTNTTRKDSYEKTKTTQTHYWTTTGTQVVTTIDVAAHDEIYIDGQWVTAVHHDWILFDGILGPYWVYGDGEHISDLMAWILGIDSRHVAATYKNETVATAGDFNSYNSTGVVPVESGTTLDQTGAYNPSSVTAGTISLSDVTLKTGTKTTVANTLTANAEGSLSANGVQAGKTSLTSANSSVSLTNTTGYNNIKGLLTANAATTLDISNTKVKGNVKAQANNDITIDNLTTKALGNRKGDVLANSASGNVEVKNSTLANKLTSLAKNITINNTSANALKANATNKLAIGQNSVFTTAKAFATDIDIDSSKIKGGTLSASNEINVKNQSRINNTTLKASASDINVNASIINNSILRSNNNINVSNNSKVIGSSTLKSGKNININTSLIKDSTLNAGSSTDVRNNSIVTNSKILATDNISVDNSKVRSSILKASKDINVSNASVLSASTLISRNNNINIESSRIKDMKLRALNNVSIEDTRATGSLIAKATNGNIELTNVQGKANARLTAGTDTKIKGSTLGRTVINSGNDTSIGFYAKYMGNNTIKLFGSTLGNTIINSGNDTDIAISNLGNTTINSGRNTGIIIASLKDTIINSAGNTGILLAELGDTTINSGGTTTFGYNVANSLNINSLSDVILYDVNVLNDTNIASSNSGNITIQGLYTGNNLNITGGDTVLILNSESAPGSYPTIAELAVGRTPISDYNPSKYNDAYFDDILSSNSLPPYGEGTRISYIGGDLNISGANNVGIANTAIIGNLNESNITDSTFLITSYVGGDYTPDRASIGGDANVYKSYINGQFIPYFNTDETDLTNIDEVNKQKYGNPLDTIFRQQFNPRGFAAGEDEINLMKKTTLASVMKGKNPNSFSFTKGFTAY